MLRGAAACRLVDLEDQCAAQLRKVERLSADIDAAQQLWIAAERRQREAKAQIDLAAKLAVKYQAERDAKCRAEREAREEAERMQVSETKVVPQVSSGPFAATAAPGDAASLPPRPEQQHLSGPLLHRPAAAPRNWPSFCPETAESKQQDLEHRHRKQQFARAERLSRKRLHARNDDSVAICDLTAGDDQAPLWQARKRPKPEPIVLEPLDGGSDCSLSSAACDSCRALLLATCVCANAV